MTSDVRYVWRSIWKTPSATIGAMLALGLGIGATTTMFTFISAVLLRPLPYPDAARLVEIFGNVQRETVERRGASYPDLYDWRRSARSFDAMASWTGGNSVVFAGGGDAEFLGTETVDGPYFEMLGAAPIQGRIFDDADFRAGAAPVAVIGERLWRERYNHRSDVAGQSIQVGAQTFTIVGVVPARFQGRSDQAEVWMPAAAAAQGSLTQRGTRGFTVLARLAPGVTATAAQAEMDAVCAQLAQAYPQTNEKRGAEVMPLAESVFQNVRASVSLLFGAVALVLLIACANVAALLLARGEGRRRELSLRRALGATDRQLVRLLLTESAVLVVLGGALGLLLSQWLGGLLTALNPVQLPSFAQPALDWRTAAFLALVGIVTTVATGLAPLGTLRQRSLAIALREGGVASPGAGGVGAMRVIVIGEVTLAVALLVGATLLSRSFAALLRFDPGFAADNVLVLRVQLPVPPSTAATPQAAPPAGAWSGLMPLLDSLRAVPGVLDASAGTAAPLQGTSAVFYTAEHQPDFDATNRPRAYLRGVAPGYFAALRMPIVDGRDLQMADMAAGVNTVVVSENVARRFWPGQSAVGRRVKLGAANSRNPWVTIVGVVREANMRAIPRNPTADPDLYFPFPQPSRFFALLRTSGDPDSVGRAARAAVARAVPGASVLTIFPLSTLVDAQRGPARFLSWLIGAFAAIAGTLAVIGIYGMFSFWMRRRRTEIGIRAALGASRGRLLALVVAQAAVMTGCGIALGMLLAAGLTRLLAASLVGVQPMDWVSFATTAAVMLAAGLIASAVPTVATLRRDPIAAIRAPRG